VGQSPHVLRLYLRPMEAALDQNPHKQGEEVWWGGGGVSVVQNDNMG
jgi:hypothetical protein